jgi:hypothetical protein
MLAGLESVFFFSFYLWTAAFVPPLAFSFHFSLFLFLILARCFSYILPTYLSSFFFFFLRF